MKKLFIIFSLIFFLSGCGQSGRLYLPVQPTHTDQKSQNE